MRCVFRGAAWPVGRTGLTVAICIGLVLAACSAETSRSPVATPLIAPSASATPAIELEWQTIGGGPLPGRQVYLTDMATQGDTVVAIGAVVEPSSETSTAHIWVSPADGPWTEATVEGSEGAWPQTVIATESGFLAAGWTGTGSPLAYAEPSSCQTAVWSSADGATWTRQADPRIDRGTLTGVVPWEGGFLAVGARDIGTGGDQGQGVGPTDAGATAPPSTHPEPAGLILRSDDGTAWGEIAPGADMTGSPLSAIATDGDRLVAVSLSDRSSQRSAEAPGSAWISTDAVHWTAQPLKTEVFPFLFSVASTPGGFVISGMAPGFMGVGSGPASWRETADGWVELGLSTGWEERIFIDLAAGPAGALIIGVDALEPLLYGSQDGSAWMRVDATGVLATMAFQPTALAWAGSHFLLAGQTRTPDGVQSYVLAGLPHLPSAAEVAAGSIEPSPTPTAAPTPEPLSASGRAWIELDGVAGYTPQPQGIAACTALSGGTQLGGLRADDAGELEGVTVSGGLWETSPLAVGRSVRVHVESEPATPDGVYPTWQGPGQVVELGADGTSGSVAFSNVPIYSEEVGRLPAGWPEQISGSLHWVCDPWLAPGATPPPSSVGSLTLELEVNNWSPAGGAVTCQYDPSGAVAAVLGEVGTLGDQAMSLTLRLGPHLRAGKRTSAVLWAMPLGSDPRWDGLATLTEVAEGSMSGAATFEGDFYGSGDGRAVLAGQLRWTCRP